MATLFFVHNFFHDIAINGGVNYRHIVNRTVRKPVNNSLQIEYTAQSPGPLDVVSTRQHVFGQCCPFGKPS